MLVIEARTFAGEQEDGAVVVLCGVVVDSDAVAAAMCVARRSVGHSACIEEQSGRAADVGAEGESSEPQPLYTFVRAPVVPQQVEAAWRLVGFHSTHFTSRVRTQFIERQWLHL